jgi:hypothetical protein
MKRCFFERKHILPLVTGPCAKAFKEFPRKKEWRLSCPAYLDFLTTNASGVGTATFSEKKKLFYRQAVPVMQSLNQVCQMVYFQTENLGKFWRVSQWKTLIYFMGIWSFYNDLVYFMSIWYIFW